MFVFRNIWRALFSCNTRFEIRLFVLLPTNLRKNVKSLFAKYILRKIGLFQSFWYPVVMFYAKWPCFFCYKICEAVRVDSSIRLFWSKQKWMDKMACFNFLRNSSYTQKLVPETVREAFTLKFICDHFFITMRVG